MFELRGKTVCVVVAEGLCRRKTSSDTRRDSNGHLCDVLGSRLGDAARKRENL